MVDVRKEMKNPTYLLLALFFAMSPLHGQEPEDISPHIKTIINGSGVPALAAAAVLDGKIVSLGAAGVRKKGDPIAVTTEDKFHIGSCTKSMTATLGAILIEDGKLQWDTKLSEVFHDLDIHEDYKNVTFDQLVTNTAGVPGDIQPDLWSALWKREGSERAQRLRLVQGILREPPAYKPGSDQVYSNAGFSIAGAMLEAITDRSYEELLTERLFNPLGMTSGGFRAPASNGHVDQPYGHTKSFFMVSPADPEPKGDNPPAIAPAGAVHCSVLDFARYALLHLGRADKGNLTKKSLDKLHESIQGKDYGRGWVVTNRPWAKGRAITHAGSNTMFYAVIWIAPEREFAAVAMCNYGDQEGFTKCDETIGYLIKRHLK
jgi:CubicO group peptidase (beta-lactamase class C family)